MPPDLRLVPPKKRPRMAQPKHGEPIAPRLAPGVAFHVAPCCGCGWTVVRTREQAAARPVPTCSVCVASRMESVMSMRRLALRAMA